ncbi:MAG: hypothetical protein HRT87_10925, partial [Legionellales bacterium]|nr:hypothetical protein [Legionellales bacterium]
KAKLTYDENTQTYNQEVELVGKDLMINTSNNISALIYDYLLNETDAVEIKKKILFLCETAQNLAENGNFFALEPILKALKQYLSIIKLQEIDGTVQNLSNFGILSEEINKAVFSFRNNTQLRVGLSGGNHAQDNVKFPAMMKTIEQLELNLLEVTTHSGGVEKTERLIKLKKYQDKIAKEIDMCTGIRATNNPPEQSTPLYLELASEDFRGIKSSTNTMQQIKRMYTIRESKSIQVQKSYIPQKWKKSGTHTKMKKFLGSIEKSYQDKTNRTIPNLPPLPNKIPRYMSYIVDKMENIDENEQEVNLDREVFLKYITYTLSRIRAKKDGRGYTLKEDPTSDYFEIYLNQIMLDYEDHHIRRPPEDYLEIFENYAEMNLIYHGKIPNGINPLDWRHSLKEFGKFAESLSVNIQPISIDENNKNYISNIILSIKKDSDLNNSPKHASTQKYFKFLIEETDLNLTINSSPEDFINAINNKLSEINISENEDEYYFYKYALDSFNASSQDLNFKQNPILQDLHEHTRYNLIKNLVSLSATRLNLLRQDPTIGQCFTNSEKRNQFFQNIRKIQIETSKSEHDNIDNLLTNTTGNDDLDNAAKNIIKILDDEDFTHNNFVSRLTAFASEVTAINNLKSLSLEYIQHILKNICVENATNVNIFKAGSTEDYFRHYLVNIARNHSLKFTDDPNLFLNAINTHAENKDVYDKTGDEHDYNLDDWDIAFAKFNQTISQHKSNPQKSPSKIQLEQQTKYAKLILDSIKNQTILDSLPIHKKTKKIFEK